MKDNLGHDERDADPSVPHICRPSTSLAEKSVPRGLGIDGLIDLFANLIGGPLLFKRDQA